MERLDGAICRFEYSFKTDCCSSTYSHSNGSLFKGEWGKGEEPQCVSDLFFDSHAYFKGDR